MPVQATINVNRSGGSVTGGDDTNNILKDIRSLLKKQGNVADKQAKLGQSGGFGIGGGGMGGMLSKVLGVGGGAVGAALGAGTAAGVGAAAWTENVGRDYTEAMVDGKEMILEINRSTGKVENQYTIQQAINKGIINADGEILSYLELSEKKLQENFGEYKIQNGILIITNKDLEDISSETHKQAMLAREVTKRWEEKLNNMGGDADDPAFDVPAPGRMSMRGGGSHSGQTGPMSPIPSTAVSTGETLKRLSGQRVMQEFMAVVANSEAEKSTPFIPRLFLQ